MPLTDDRFSQKPGPLKQLADRLGSAVTGQTAPTGIRLYLADRLVRKASGLILFDGLGERMPLPAAVLDGTIPLRGIWILRINRESDGRNRYAFAKTTRFGTLGMYRERTFRAHYTIVENP